MREESPVVPAKNGRPSERRLAAGSFCDEFVAKAADEERNEPEGGLQPAGFPSLTGTTEESLRLQKMVAFEEEARRQGYKRIAGIDEAGRGPLAGPVVAAACVLPEGWSLAGVNDSKKLSPQLRKRLFDRIIADAAVLFGVGIVDVAEIDRVNIYQATIAAMLEAVKKLPSDVDFLLVDGMSLPQTTIPSKKIIKGDQLSLSIAAASIIAKETRDQMMRDYHQQWPEYGFGKHMGYGTAQHLAAIEKYGPCPIHRVTFSPVKDYMELAKETRC